jgi:beta-galactosidase/beta-glucuronidase
MLTPWGERLDASAPLPEYPRPQLVRDDWSNLNGVWRYAITPFAESDPLAVPEPTSRPGWDGDIVVPFSPEMPLSGVNRTLRPGEVLWYGRRFALASPAEGRRVLLHFGAVDQTCRVAVDGIEVGGHTGGYLPFSFDITGALADRPEHEVVVAVRDVTDASWLSRGKQATRPGGIWYTPQSGIWQTVWLEVVPEVAVDGLELLPDLATGSVVLTVRSDRATPGTLARVTIMTDAGQVAAAEVPVGAPTPVSIAEPHLWSPEDPFLYDIEVSLGEDRVTSYVGMRSFGLGTDDTGHPRLLLNGDPYLPIGLLDQGYWPDGGYTAPSDEALVFDIELARSLGYTMLRKHIKVEPLRWYHHCDRLGMLVWQDAVSGGTAYNPIVTQGPAVGGPQLDDRRHRLFARASKLGREQYEAELAAMVEHLRSVTSLALWVPFNEGWGQFDAARIADVVRELDPSRPVDHASGWHDQGAGDLHSLHIYFRRVKLPKKRDARVLALTEYGGYSLAMEGHTWGTRAFGYKMLGSREEWQDAVVRLHDEQVRPAIEAGLGAIVYTQLSDVEDEVNGLVTYDRRVVKADAEMFRAMNDRLRAAETGVS